MQRIILSSDSEERCEGRVSKDGAAPCFETGASRPPQHEAERGLRIPRMGVMA